MSSLWIPVRKEDFMSFTIQAPAIPPASTGRIRGLQCRECGQLYPAEARHVCEQCFGPLEVAYDYDVVRGSISRQSIERGPRTLWRKNDTVKATFSLMERPVSIASTRAWEGGFSGPSCASTGNLAESVDAH